MFHITYRFKFKTTSGLRRTPILKRNFKKLDDKYKRVNILYSLFAFKNFFYGILQFLQANNLPLSVNFPAPLVMTIVLQRKLCFPDFQRVKTNRNTANLRRALIFRWEKL